MSDAAAVLPEEHRSYSVIELNAYVFDRFLGCASDEVREFCVLPTSQKQVPQVAYATSIESAMRLMREGENIPGTGVYRVANKITPSIAARYASLGRWHRADAGRAADHETEEARVIYVDCDAVRVKGISATNVEKACSYELLQRVEEFFAHRLGDDRTLGRGDSGNGFSLFIATEPFKPTKETGERIERLLKGLAQKFKVDGAKIDTSVFNPARLVPAFGTLKCKGADTQDRPHRATYFCCRPVVRRIPLEVLC